MNRARMVARQLPGKQPKCHGGQPRPDQRHDLRGEEMAERGIAQGAEHQSSFGQGLDLGQIMRSPARQAVVDVVVDQCPLRLSHGAFDGVELGRQIDARPPLLDHADDAAQMPLGSLQPVAMAGWLAWV